MEGGQISNKKRENFLKNVLHRGYWKYKKEHYRGLENHADNKTKVGLSEAFGSAILNALEVGNVQTEIEIKHQGRFDYTDS